MYENPFRCWKFQRFSLWEQTAAYIRDTASALIEHFTLHQIFSQKEKEMYSLMWRNTCSYFTFFVRTLSSCSVKPWRINSALCELIGEREAVDPAGEGLWGEPHKRTISSKQPVRLDQSDMFREKPKTK